MPTPLHTYVLPLRSYPPVVRLAGGGYLPLMAFGPVHEALNQLQECAPQRSQRVLDLRRSRRVHGPRDKTIPFESPERDGKHPLTDARDAAPQVREPLRALPEDVDYEDRPTVADAVKDLPG